MSERRSVRPSSMASSELQSCVEALRIQLEEERKRRLQVVQQIRTLTSSEPNENSLEALLLPPLVRGEGDSDRGSRRSQRSQRSTSIGGRVPTPPTLEALANNNAKSSSTPNRTSQQQQLDQYLRSLPTDLGGEAPPVQAAVRRGAALIKVPKPPTVAKRSPSQQPTTTAEAPQQHFEPTHGSTVTSNPPVKPLDPKILEEKRKLDAAVRRHHSPIGIRNQTSPSREILQNIEGTYRALCTNAKVLKKPPIPQAAKGIRGASGASGGGASYTLTGHRKATAAEVYIFQKRHEDRMNKIHAFNFLD